MTKKEALKKYFSMNPALLKVLKQHCDGLSCKAKATRKGGKEQTVKNQQSSITKIFGVKDMDEACHHAMHYEILPQLPVVPISDAWSKDLQDYFSHYIMELTGAQKREMGIEEE